MGFKPLSPEQVELTLLLGSNYEKWDAVSEMNQDQLKRLATDLFSRPGSLQFFDYSKHPRGNSTDLEKVSGEDVMEEILRQKKIPSQIGLPLIKYLIEQDRFETSLGSKVLRDTSKLGLGEEYLYKFLADNLPKENQQRLFGKIRMESKQFAKYHNLFLVKLQNCGSFKQLQRVTEVVAGLIPPDDRRKYRDMIEKIWQQKIKTFDTKELLYHYKATRDFRDNNSYYANEMSRSNQSIIRKILKEELAVREHIPTAAQSKLIRQMSKHAGQKLTLHEAQILSNQLKKIYKHL